MPNLFFPSSKPIFIEERKIIKKLRNLALKVAKKNKNVESIYLFGSFAQGNASLRSDADILVVLGHDKRNMMERLDKFILAFSEGPVPVDVLVYTRTELNKALKQGNNFLSKAQSGIKLV